MDVFDSVCVCVCACGAVFVCWFVCVAVVQYLCVFYGACTRVCVHLCKDVKGIDLPYAVTVKLSLCAMCTLS